MQISTAMDQLAQPVLLALLPLLTLQCANALILML